MVEVDSQKEKPVRVLSYPAGHVYRDRAASLPTTFKQRSALILARSLAKSQKNAAFFGLNRWLPTGFSKFLGQTAKQIGSPAWILEGFNLVAFF
jgi:hypothetical protein